MSPRGARWLRRAAWLMVTLGVGMTFDRLWTIGSTEPAVGTVVEQQGHNFTVSFTADAGVVRFSRTLPGPKDENERLAVGRRVPVRYRASDPTDAHVVSTDFWYFPLGFLLVGALGVAAATYARRSAGLGPPPQ